MQNLVGHVVPAAAALAAIPVIQQRLGNEQLGVLMLAWALVGYVGVFDLGLRRGLSRIVAAASGDSERTHTLIWTSVWCLTMLGAIAGVVLLASGPMLLDGLSSRAHITRTTGWATLVALAVSLPAVAIFSALSGVLEGRERFGLLNAARIPTAVASYLAPALATLVVPSVAPAILVLALTRVVGTAGIWFVAHNLEPGLRRMRRPTRASLRELADIGGWLTIANLAGSAMLYLDRLCVGLLVPLGLVAFYTTPQELVSKLLIISAATSSTVFPRFSALVASRSTELARVYERARTTTLLALFVPLFGIALLAREALGIWLDADFVRESTPVLRWLSLGTLLAGTAAVPLALLQAAGRSRLTAAFAVGVLPVYGALVWSLTTQYGISGAAAAWAIRMVIEHVLLFGAARQTARGLTHWPQVAAAAMLALVPVLTDTWPLITRILLVAVSIGAAWTIAHVHLGLRAALFLPRAFSDASDSAAYPRVSERLVIGQGARPHVVREHVARYEFASQFAPGRRTLDIACGSGYGAAMLQQAGAAETLGVDLAEEAIDHARRLYGASGASFMTGSADALRLDRVFDLIVCLETIEHLQEPDAFLRRTTTLLADQGLLVISTPVRLTGTLESRPRNPLHVREWSTSEFENLLRLYYGQVEMFGQFSFRKGRVPYSRTLKRWWFAQRFPAAAQTIERFEVLPEPPRYPGFNFAMAYMVAVCRNPKMPADR